MYKSKNHSKCMTYKGVGTECNPHGIYRNVAKR